MTSESAIPMGSTVLVTGVNSYIGSHIADQLLSAGYKVKGTVRSNEKGQMIAEALGKRHHSNNKDAFTYIVVEDMSTEAAFHDAVQGCSGVAHVASDLTFRDDPNLVIPPVMAGVQNALKAAASTPSVKRFVLTSSSDACVAVQPNTPYHITQDSWNEVAPKAAWKLDEYPAAAWAGLVYAASKTEGERAAWKFVETEKPGFVLNTVCPNFNVGEVLDKRQYGSTAGLIRGLWDGNEQAITMLKYFLPQFSIDVKDDARLHVAGLTMTDVKGERLLGFNEPVNYSRWCELLKKVDPSKSFPPPAEDEGKTIATTDMKRSIELLKRMSVTGLTSTEESVKQMIASVS